MHQRDRDAGSGRVLPVDVPTGPDERPVFGRALILAVVLTLVVGLVPYGAWSTTAQTGRPGAPVFVEPGVRGPSVIATRAGIDPAAVAAQAGVTPGFVFDTAATGFSANLSDANVQALAANDNVSSIIVDREVTIADYTSYIPRTGADTSSVARIGQGANHNVGIAILDTGVGPVGGLNVVGGVNCIDGSSYADNQGHGTHVAGIAAARNNGSGVAGVAAGARIYSVKVLNAAGSGSITSLICGLEWVAENSGGINVANLSLGVRTSAGAACGTTGASALRNAVCGVIDEGIPVVVAAGNDGVDASSFSPANFPEVITVASLSDTNGRPGGGGAGCTARGVITADDSFSAFSNYGSLVDIIAPGGCITSLSRNGGTEVRSGTSMAAPAVAGAVALYGGLGGITVPQTSTFGLRYAANNGTTAGVLYIGNGSNPGATATPTRQATATRQATSTPTRQATATPTRQAGATATPGRPPRGTSTPRATATATRQATSTPTSQPGVTATPTRQATSTPAASGRPTRPPRTRSSDIATPTVRATTAPQATSTRAVSTSRPSRPPRVRNQGLDLAATVTAQRPARGAAPATTAPATPPQSPATATGVPATATSVPATATSAPTSTPVPPTETPVPPTATTAPTETPVPPTEVPTEVPTEIPTEIPTEVPVEIPTEIPTEVVPAVTPTIAPVNVTDNLGNGTVWYVLDDDETTTWYMTAPAPVVATEPVIQEPVIDPAAGDAAELPTEVPVEIPVQQPVVEPEDLALVLDLGYVQTVGSARWLWTDATYAHGVEIQVSLDGETWTTVAYPDTWNTIPGEYQTAEIWRDARYVRFMFPNAEQLPQVGGLAEVEIIPTPIA